MSQVVDIEKDAGSAGAKLIYIVGCGRSGSTALGFCLGSADGLLDVGELICLARQNGHPKGFGPETDNYQFWSRILAHVSNDPRWPGLERFLEYERRFDTHSAFMMAYLFEPVLRPFGLAAYRDALQCLYEAVLNSGQWHGIIDGSKYPSRLLHLSKVIHPERLRAIFLVRDPASLCVSFRNPAQGKPRRSLMTLAYYFVNNFLAVLTLRRLPKDNYCTVRYEDLAREPTDELRRIGAQTGINVESAVALIEQGLPLRKGFVVNGNRMRKKSEIIFRRSSPKLEPLSIIPSIIARILRLAFFRDPRSSTSP